LIKKKLHILNKSAMKQEILTKLFNGEELSSQELVYIGKNLNNDLPPVKFDHEKTDSLEACGIDKDSIKQMNTVFNDIMKTKRDDGMSGDRMSVLVEEVEKIVLKNEQFLRLVIIQCIQASMNHQLKMDKESSSGIEKSESDGSIADMILRMLKSKKGKSNDQEEKGE